MVKQQQSEKLNPETISEIRRIYDEREQRLAVLMGRDLFHDERLNLAVDGVIKFCAGLPLKLAGKAIDKIDTFLRTGLTVGDALAKAL